MTMAPMEITSFRLNFEFWVKMNPCMIITWKKKIVWRFSKKFKIRISWKIRESLFLSFTFQLDEKFVKLCLYFLKNVFIFLHFVEFFDLLNIFDFDIFFGSKYFFFFVKLPKNRSMPWWSERLNFVDPNPDELSANRSHKSCQWRSKMWPKMRSIWTTEQDFPYSTNVQLVSGTKSPKLKIQNLTQKKNFKKYLRDLFTFDH